MRRDPPRDSAESFQLRLRGMGAEYARRRLLEPTSSASSVASPSWPSQQSSNFATGHEIGDVTMSSTRIKGERKAAMRICEGPVMIAEGRISPKTSTHVIEMRIDVCSSTR